MINGYGIYTIAGIIFIILVLLYVFYLLAFKPSTSFAGIEDLKLLTEKPINGKIQYKADLMAFGSNINRSMSMGFVLYLVSPESNINQRRNIFSIYDKKVNVPIPGSACKEAMTAYNTPSDASEFPGVYLDDDGSTLQFVFQTESGNPQIMTYKGAPYNKICVVNLFMSRRHVDLFIDGELAKTHQFTENLDYDCIKKSSTNLICGYCDGFSGYLYNIQLWNKSLTQKQLQDYVVHSKSSYEKAAKSSKISGNEVIPCAN